MFDSTFGFLILKYFEFLGTLGKTDSEYSNNPLSYTIAWYRYFLTLWYNDITVVIIYVVVILILHKFNSNSVASFINEGSSWKWYSDVIFFVDFVLHSLHIYFSSLNIISDVIDLLLH